MNRVASGEERSSFLGFGGVEFGSVVVGGWQPADLIALPAKVSLVNRRRWIDNCRAGRDLMAEWTTISCPSVFYGSSSQLDFGATLS